MAKSRASAAGCVIPTTESSILYQAKPGNGCLHVAICGSKLATGWAVFCFCTCTAAGADERDKQDVAGGAVEGISKKGGKDVAVAPQSARGPVRPTYEVP
ncbi:hypothetical protein PVAP13_3KG389927 [Panicum virgatum]|uniref:Uncharacterized protein n=1 Tax=Panicum virgatum TaxID=38727 RepID=A0A8T0UVW7_PANVG|nr:hypothetical protein PVAP13_3KG389927 [Panicum virgatum]